MLTIADHCKAILDLIKDGVFTRRELELNLKFFKELVESTERLLGTDVNR